ncbi:hypothetical protein OJAV_G00215480 [Oryzias javanicus]|uniref:Uncharacterized protein n=1 Tax=Oryzias javanicus TaxID=123683 RepID=A0A437C470_ORYJA|nr:hypothetical protein OJAV_G00215480 [Oryzias javanicus]
MRVARWSFSKRYIGFLTLWLLWIMWMMLEENKAEFHSFVVGGWRSCRAGGVMGRRINTKQEEGSNETWSFEMETRRFSPTDFGFSAACLTRFCSKQGQ